MYRRVLLITSMTLFVSSAIAQTSDGQLAIRPSVVEPADNREFKQHPNAFTPVAGSLLATGMSITPTAAPGSVAIQLNPGLADNPSYIAGQPSSTAVSPDGNTLLVLTSGYNDFNDSMGNAIPTDSNEYVFVFDISKNTLTQKQVIQVPNTFFGIAWNPNGQQFVVTGGIDDNVHIYNLSNGAFVAGASIPLGHTGSPLFQGLQIAPAAAGIAVNAAGTQALVANLQNDSVSLVDLVGGKVLAEQDLRPGIVDPSQTGVAGGEYPFWVLWTGNTAYVSSLRDREIVVLDLSSGAPKVSNRIAVNGNPNKMITFTAVNGRQILLAAVDNEDNVVAIDTGLARVIDTIPVTAPPASDQTIFSQFLKGANPNSLTLSPDHRILYVTNGGENAIAVIALNTYIAPSYVKGLIPTGWYPSAVALSKDGSTLFNAFTKNIPGPNPNYCLGCYQINQYDLQLQKGGMLTIPVPNNDTLFNLTQQVAVNDNFAVNPNHQANADVMAALHSNIQHVIYIIRENRTYDQVLGDLPVGNGDPALAALGASITPNIHALATNFVDLDNFYDTGEVSGVGWNWSTASRVTDYGEKTINLNYAYPGRFSNYDFEGTNRNLNVGYATAAQRIAALPVTPNDPNYLPGAVDVTSADSSEGIENGGFLWDAAQRAGLSVRNYGFFIDLARYSLPAPLLLPTSTTPFASNLIQAYATKPGLIPYTDQYFRGFDNTWPDYYREQEWEREFNQYVANNNLPALELVRLMHDHTGNFSTAQFGVNTPALQVADNDYAVALLIQKVASSPYANNTLIFIVEDDAQDGPDHVDAHRSIAFVVGPYVKKNVVVATQYSTVNLLRTIKDVLGIPYYGLYDGTQEPMADIFDLTQTTWTFKAQVPAGLKGTSLPVSSSSLLPKHLRLWRAGIQDSNRAQHSAAYWSKVMEGQDFDEEDKLDTVAYNRALWKGLMGDDVPYPAVRDGRDLRQNRAQLLKDSAAQQRAAKKHKARHTATVEKPEAADVD